MDNISTAGWLLIILALTLMMFLLTAVFTLVTGGLCGYFMSKLTVRRGLWYGLLVSLPATAIRYAIESYPALPQPRYNLFEVILIAGTVGLCWWKTRGARTHWHGKLGRTKSSRQRRNGGAGIKTRQSEPTTPDRSTPRFLQSRPNFASRPNCETQPNFCAKPGEGSDSVPFQVVCPAAAVGWIPAFAGMTDGMRE